MKKAILTRAIKQEIKEFISNWLDNKGYYISAVFFEVKVDEIMQNYNLDSYSNTRYFCKQILESLDHGIDLTIY